MAYNTQEERLKVKGSEQITRDLKVNRDAFINNKLEAGRIESKGDLSVAGEVVAGDDVSIAGDLYVNGTEYISNTETAQTTDNYLVLRHNQTGSLASGEHSGVAVHNYTVGKTATITADNAGTWRVADNTETDNNYTNVSYYDGTFYTGLTRTVATVVSGMKTAFDEDELDESVYYNNSYYHFDGSHWYPVSLTDNKLTLGSAVTDSATITALNALTKSDLIYFRTLTVTTINELENQPLLTRDETTDMADGQTLVWDNTNEKAVTQDAYPPITFTYNSQPTDGEWIEVAKLVSKITGAGVNKRIMLQGSIDVTDRTLTNQDHYEFLVRIGTVSGAAWDTSLLANTEQNDNFRITYAYDTDHIVVRIYAKILEEYTKFHTTISKLTDSTDYKNLTPILGSGLVSTNTSVSAANIVGTVVPFTEYFDPVTNALVNLPTDSVLHYSFDEVPDYPDRTADLLQTQFTSTTGWTAGNGTTISIENNSLKLETTGSLQYALAVNSAFSGNTLKGKIVKVKVVSNDPIFRCYMQEQNGSTYPTYELNLVSQNGNEYIFCGLMPSDMTYTSYIVIQFGGTLKTAYIKSIYVGDGSYATPIIDNANGQNNGTNNGAIAEQGLSGKGAYFPSANQEVRIPVTNLPAPTSNDNITISCWLKINSDYANDTTNSVKPLIAIGSYTGVFGLYRGRNSIGFRNRDSSADRAVGLTMKKDGKWHNYIGVYDGTTHKSTLYEDGVLVGTSEANIADYQFGSSNTYWRVWSNTAISGSVGDTTNQPATLDDILIFNRALSQEEVTALYLNKANTPKYFPQPTNKIEQNNWGLATSNAVAQAISSAVNTAIDNEATARNTAITNAINALDVSSVGGSGKYISAISETNGKISATATTMDTTPTASSTKACTSGGIKTYVDNAVAGATSSVAIAKCGTATCSTAAGTVAKTVTLAGFTLTKGAMLAINLSNANTVASATLNVNSTGAKTVYINGGAVTASNWTAGVWNAYYDGTAWYLTSYQVDTARSANYAESATNASWAGSASTAMSANKIRTSRPSSPTNGDIWIE